MVDVGCKRLSATGTVIISTIIPLVCGILAIVIANTIVSEISDDVGFTVAKVGKIVLAWVLLVGVARVSWVAARLKRVFLCNTTLQIHGLFSSAEVGLDEIDAVVWIQMPESEFTSVAALRLRRTSAFGSEIWFSPRSNSTVEYVRKILAAREQRSGV